MWVSTLLLTITPQHTNKCRWDANVLQCLATYWLQSRWYWPGNHVWARVYVDSGDCSGNNRKQPTMSVNEAALQSASNIKSFSYIVWRQAPLLRMRNTRVWEEGWGQNYVNICDARQVLQWSCDNEVMRDTLYIPSCSPDTLYIKFSVGCCSLLLLSRREL